MRPDYAAQKAWPFEEARKIIQRYQGILPAKGYVLFETGYGPSGLPHIGTFGEVLRTSMVRYALEQMTGWPTRLYAFSDDMDGLRKVPGNVPQQEMLAEHLHKPLSQIPDPFGTHTSFGAHNNARLCAFLDAFNFSYEFQSSTEYYKSGKFDAALLNVLQHHDAIVHTVLPTLGAERKATYSAFLPICPHTGQVLQVPVVAIDTAAGTITYDNPNSGVRETTLVTGGRCKLQWKVDWAMRWVALGVDYEMSGKDLIDSVKLSSKIARILGSQPPESLTYELFLDEKGEKISKSKGNGLSMEDWLKYAPPESLALYMFQQPKRAKRLYFDCIPKAVDEYATFVEKFPAQDVTSQADNPAWHIHQGQPPALTLPVSFSLLLNLAAVCNAETANVLWGFISRYAPEATPETQPYLDKLVHHAVAYYQDIIKPAKQYRNATAMEAQALRTLASRLKTVAADSDAEALQTIVYEVGTAAGFEPLRSWFVTIYEVLLGQSQGPRFGSFIALYGVQATIALIEKRLDDNGTAAAGH